MKLTVRWIVFALSLAAACALLAAQKIQLTAASIVPAARGEIEIGKRSQCTHGNKNDRSASRQIGKPFTTNGHLRGLVPGKGSAENRGQLEINKRLEASFRSVTPLTSSDLFVTAEPAATAKTPGGTRGPEGEYP